MGQKHHFNELADVNVFFLLYIVAGVICHGGRKWRQSGLSSNEGRIWLFWRWESVRHV